MPSEKSDAVADVPSNIPKPNDPATEISQGIREEFERRLSQRLGKIDPSVRRQVVQETVEFAVEFSGPLPPAPMLKSYDQVVPGSAARLIAMAEKEQAHLHAMERRRVQLPFTLELCGILGGIVVTIVGLSLGAYCIVNGYTIVGAALFGGTLAAIVSSLVRGRSGGMKPPVAEPSQQKGKRSR